MSTALTEHLEPRIVPRAEHTVSRRLISSGALKVLYRLRRSGYTAYLVGGGVRDLLLGGRPKDFDVVTNARPREIRRLFRNSRVIGRRFRLVHVLFHGEIVEVATFRASPEPPEVPDGWEDDEEREDESPGEAPDGAIHFGTPAEDARRRDFTINALFYDIADYSVIDYVGGLDDLDSRVLRTIGPAVQRFREDPVRMLRALEYMVRLGFELDPECAEAIEQERGEINSAAPSRLAYELLETLRSASAAGICQAWRRFGMLELVYPEGAAAGPALGDILEVVDRQTAQHAPLSDAVLLGAPFLPAFVGLLRAAITDNGRISNPMLLDGLAGLLEPAVQRLHISHRNLHQIRQGLFTISKMGSAPERARQVTRLVRQDSFATAWDLYSLGVESGLLPREPYKAWSRALVRLEKGGSLDDLGGESSRPRRRRRRPGRRKKT